MITGSKKRNCRDKQIMILVTSQEKEILKIKANEDGLGVSTFIRQKALQSCKGVNNNE